MSETTTPKDRPVEFKKELIALLAKYDAQMEVEESEGYIHSPKIVVHFNSIWENDGNVNIDEYHKTVLGNQIYP